MRVGTSFEAHVHVSDFVLDYAGVQFIEQVYFYITKNEYPEGTSESRKHAIRKKAKRFIVSDGVQAKTKYTD